LVPTIAREMVEEGKEDCQGIHLGSSPNALSVMTNMIPAVQDSCPRQDGISIQQSLQLPTLTLAVQQLTPQVALITMMKNSLSSYA